MAPHIKPPKSLERNGVQAVLPNRCGGLARNWVGGASSRSRSSMTKPLPRLWRKDSTKKDQWSYRAWAGIINLVIFWDSLSMLRFYSEMASRLLALPLSTSVPRSCKSPLWFLPPCRIMSMYMCFLIYAKCVGRYDFLISSACTIRMTEDATNAEEWGPTTTTMASISEASRTFDEYERIVQVLRGR